MKNTEKESIIRIMIEKKTREITVDQINPYIRRASKHAIEAGLNTGLRINRHYQLHYIIKGTGSFTIEQTQYLVSEGDFLIWGPGEVHTIFSDKEDPLKVIGIQFDITRNYCEDNYSCIHYKPSNFSWDIVNECIVIKGTEAIPAYTKVMEKQMIKGYLENIVRFFDSNSVYSQYIMSGMLQSVILLILEENTYKEEKFRVKKYVIKEVEDYIHEHSSEHLTNAFLGERYGYHPNYLNQLFLTHTGYTMQQYIIHIRMNKAVDLLTHTNQSISEIGQVIGGYSIHYFSRLFKKKMGLAPSDYRR